MKRVTSETSYVLDEAARIKGGGQLSLADAWMAALALLRDAQLVHQDPEFDNVADLRSVKL